MCAVSSSCEASRPGRSTTNALGRSPQWSSGTPMTATSSTAGWLTIACSTSIVEMFSPPEITTSLARSRSSM